MANKVTTPDDVKVKMLIDAVRAIDNAKTVQQVQAANRLFQKAARNIGLTDAQTEALTKILEQPGEIAALSSKTIITLAEKNATQLIDLKRQWADAYMRQGNSIAGIAGAARALGSICAMFGATEFADMLNEKADAEMLRADIQFAKARSKMEEDTGSTEAMRKAIADSLGVLTDKTPGRDISAATTAAAIHASRTAIIDTYGNVTGADSTTAETEGKRAITWQQFHQNMKSVGIDPITREKMHKLFDNTSNFVSGSNPKEVDSPVEEAKLVKGIEKSNALTQDQKTQLYAKLNLRAPEPTPP